MGRLSQFVSKNVLSRVQHGFMAMLFLCTYSLSAVAPFVPTATAATSKITISSHEGQLSPSGTYSSGNITTYQEGEAINFRFTLSADGATDLGSMQVKFTSHDTGCTFFDGSFIIADISATSGVEPSVTPAGSAVDNGTDWVQTLNVQFSATGTAVVTYQVKLSDTAGECSSGSPQHSRLANSPGDIVFKNIGNQNVPIPASAIIELPEITVEKWVDTNGDGTVDRLATAGEWSFSLDGGTAVQTDANGQVKFTNVSSGSHTISELNGPSEQTFLSGSGTNCAFTGPVATATVQSGTTATDALCVFNNTMRKGHIIIQKITDPATDTATQFTFTPSWGSAFTLTNGGSNDSGELAAGTYSVAEAVAGGWDLSSATCSDGSSVDAINLSAGETVTCTFTNIQRGKLVVQKTTSPSGDPQQFGITATAVNGEIVGSISGTVSDASDYEYIVKPGAYSVTETVPAGWSQTANTCENVTVNAGETKYCTITNVKHGKIVIEKQTLPNGSSQAFDFTSSYDQDGFTLSDGQQNDSGYLNPGSYSVSETQPQDWYQSGVVCNDGSTLDSIQLGAGETVTCVVTNTQKAKVTIIKNAQPNGPTDFSFTGTSPIGQFSLDDDSDNTLPNQRTFTLNPGVDYTITENLPNSEWFLDSVTCSDSGFTTVSNGLTINPGAGQDITCTFVNTKEFSLSGTKYYVNADGTVTGTGQDWAIQLLTQDEDGNWFELNRDLTDGDGNYSFSDLVDGVYRVQEIMKDGWTQIWGGVVQFTLGTTADGVVMSDVTQISGTAAPSDNLFDFANFQNGTISGYKWNDVNGDGRWTPLGETGLSGWTIFVDSNDNQTLDEGEKQIVTSANGAYTLSNMAPGTYSICESMQNGWVQTYPGTQTVPTCHQVTIDATGQAVTGMNFGNQGRGTLTVLKKLVPATDDGKFNLLINNEVKAQNVGNAGTTGAVEVAAGTHSASETAGTDTNLANYNSTFHCWDEGGEFGANGTSLEVNIEPGQNMICEFINTRKQGQVKVVKDVVNDNSGTLTHADFTFTNNGEEFTLESTEDSPSPDGEITLTLPVGTTFSIVEEDADSYEYSTSYSGDCEGMVTEDETPVCTITNDDIPHPGIKVVKSGPENIQAGEVATYTFTVTNTGDIELEIGRVVDDVAGLGIYRSGDTDDDGLLDLNETWVYQASRQLTENGSVTNTVEVCAIDEFETEVCGTDKHTTIVYTPQVLGDVVVKKNPPVLENTGNSLILPILAGLFTTVTAVIVFFDKQRTSLIEAAKRAFKTPFAVPGV